MRIVVHDYAGHPFQFDLSRELARRGHTVSHLFFGGDKGPKGAIGKTDDDPPTLTITPVDIGGDYDKGDFIGRLLKDRRYGAAAGREIARFAPDVVISGNTPLDAQGPIIAATHRAGAAFVNWVQDFYSLAIERLLSQRWAGLGALVARRYAALERRYLAQSDGVVLISDDFRRPLARYGVDERRIAVIPNWGALGSIPQRPKANPWSEAHGLMDKFVFLYSGTLALKHNPDLLWALAEAFKDDADVRVVLAASGVSVDALKSKHSADPIPNLIFMPLQPISDFPDLLGAGDVVVALLANDAGEFSVPSKVLSYLCAGRPVLLSAPLGNLAARVLDHAGAGLCAPAGDVDTFLVGARCLRADPELSLSLGVAGRRYAEATFEIGGVADRFEQVFVAARGEQ